MSNKAFDFTNRDYASIRDQLADYLKFRIPEWNPDPSDFAYSILEAVAYLGDMMSYYVDRAAQESNILTANDPENIYNLARLHGYTPGLAESAWCIAFITNMDTYEGLSDTGIVIPKGTQVAAASGGYAFEVVGDVTVGGEEDYAEVMLYEGRSKYAEVGISTGAGNQQFRLPDTKIDGRYGMLTVVVYNPTDPTDQELWSFRELLLDAPSGDHVFSIRMDADGATYIVFGDGVAGRIPPMGWTVGVNYRITAGAAANSAGGFADTSEGGFGGSLSRFISTWDDPTSNQFARVIVEGSTAPTGGRDAESIEDIRQGAINLVRSQRRAVTAFDYESIARSESSVQDALCQTMIWSRPTIWIVPKDQTMMLLYQVFGAEGLDEPAKILQRFWVSMTQLMNSVALAGVQPDVQLGIPLFFRVTVRIRIPATVDETYAVTRVQDAVYDAFNWSKVRFGESVSLDSIIRAISQAVPTTVVLTTEVINFEATLDWEAMLMEGSEVATWEVVTEHALSHDLDGQEVEVQQPAFVLTPPFYSFVVINKPEDVIVQVVKLQSTGRSRF